MPRNRGTGFSAAMPRDLNLDGSLQNFRLGRLYRIPAYTVEEIEKCQASASEGSEAAFASIGAKTENGAAISLRHAPERRPSPRQWTFTAGRPYRSNRTIPLCQAYGRPTGATWAANPPQKRWSTLARPCWSILAPTGQIKSTPPYADHM